MFRSNFITGCLFFLMISGCSGPSTVLSHAEQFTLQLPPGFVVDLELNPNTEHSTTWFREDFQASLSVDVQPLAGPRYKRLLKLGKDKYLFSLGRELQRDLGNHLKEFHDFQATIETLHGEPVLVATFESSFQGKAYRCHILLAISRAESAQEIMVDYRFPAEEAPSDKTWEELRASISWENEEGGHEKQPAGAEGEHGENDEQSKKETH